MSEADRLITLLEGKLRPLETALAEAWWETSTRASPEAAARRERIELERRELLGDPDAFAAIEAARRKADQFEPLVVRQLDVLHDAFLPHQVDADLRRRIVELEVDVETTFNTYRGEIDGRRVDDNAIADVLRTSDDTASRRAAWEASKQVGAEVADRVRELARLRNEAARRLGYRDHFALALATGELDGQRLFATLEEVDRATAAPFDEWKARLDADLAGRFGCDPTDLRPWHLDDPFFQDPPVRGALDLDPFFEHADVEALTVRSYDGLGLDTRPVLARSDLYAREGKSQHAFCIHVDREGDVRVLCNVEPNERWTETMLHEFGHAVYDRELDGSLPWLLREPAHALTTEGVAMLFGRLARDPRWLTAVAGVDAADVGALTDRLAEARRAALLVFARWVLVMTNFERGLYADPDADHDTRWWDLVEQYQRVRRPDARTAPDWAAKIHLTVAPVYYQNYLYGELFASQLQATLGRRAGGLVDERGAGRMLVDDVFRPGGSVRWDHLVERATGQPLTPAHLARQLAA
ncbi:MAG TPA: M2 family metallopeptidase [Acidimicrobiia bacterium]|nr:M2 family metallopeptidase [Acidimicrobiia bacterium]